MKTRTLLGISIAAILSLTVVAISEIPQAIAASNNAQKPDFESDTCIITGFAQSFLDEEQLSKVDCNVKAWLQDNGKHMRYAYKISGMELSDTNSDPDDDIDGIHFHKTTGAGSTPENPKGPHVLNVFGNPGVDDASSVSIPQLGLIMGIWDDRDENTTYGEPDNSHKFSENLELLCSGDIFTAVHGTMEDDPEGNPGHKAPYLKMNLVPTDNGIKACEKLGLATP